MSIFPNRSYFSSSSFPLLKWSILFFTGSLCPALINGQVIQVRAHVKMLLYWLLKQRYNCVITLQNGLVLHNKLEVSHFAKTK